MPNYTEAENVYDISSLTKVLAKLSKTHTLEMSAVAYICNKETHPTIFFALLKRKIAKKSYF